VVRPLSPGLQVGSGSGGREGASAASAAARLRGNRRLPRCLPVRGAGARRDHEKAAAAAAVIRPRQRREAGAGRSADESERWEAASRAGAPGVANRLRLTSTSIR
jgi:hypothetical protein